MDLVIKGGRFVTPAGSYPLDIGVTDGKITALSEELFPGGARIIDAAGCMLYPGGIDVHCHLPWPSRQVLSRDDILSGSRAAICGGVTTLFDFAIPELGEGLIDAVDRKLAETICCLYTDYSLHVCIREATPENLAQIPAIIAQGFFSFKIFLAYEGFRLEDQDILRVMTAVKKAGGMVTVHAENGLLADRATTELVAAGQVSLEHYPESRPAYCEVEAIQRILTYAEATKVPLHIHHVSTGAGAQLIGAARRRGIQVTGETCPQYLLYNDDMYRLPGIQATYLVIAPPLRKQADQNELWQALGNGDLSVLATDHCPYSLEQKSAGLNNFTCVPGGSGGVETRWPLMFTEGVCSGKLTPERLALLWSVNPARIFGLSSLKGTMIGCDADLIIVDPECQSTLSINNLHMNTDHTPYEGRLVRGFPLTTILRGQVVVQNGELISPPLGRVVSRNQPPGLAI